MNKFRKLTMTLALLLTAAGGAWADETLLLTIESKNYKDFKSGSKTFDDMVTVTFSNEVKNDGDNDGWYTYGESLLTVAGTNGYTITSCKFYTDRGTAKTGYTVGRESPSVYLYTLDVYNDVSKSEYIGYSGVTKIEVYGAAASSATAVDIAWDAAKKTGTFTQPAGNVTVSVEYYPQATISGTVGGDREVEIGNEMTLLDVSTLTLTGSNTLMYGISQETTTEPAQWSADVPTGTDMQETGVFYVWFYAKGFDEGVDGATETYSDSDPQYTKVTMKAKPVATIYKNGGQTDYATLKEAFLAVQNGEIIRLNEDVTVTSNTDLMTSNRASEAPVKFTIDFNGHVLDGSSVDGTFMNTEHEGDEITFIDDSEEQTGGLKGLVSGKPNSFVFASGRYNFNDMTAAEIVSMWTTQLVPFGWAMAEGKGFVDIENAPDANGFKVRVVKVNFDIIFNAANANTIEDGKGTVTVDGTEATPDKNGWVRDVKAGSEVKVKAKSGYKFKKATARKQNMM